ncbi:2-keto-3-deoxygluconate kinase [Pseudorhodobacter antarcticus]|uniref:2-keto-3-deoxygluconate kinase n=1 Tax=Pseudorhodobacter antarcticus TaxID=1077947 RepID=A0A1H8EBI9_9RHOB|nr:2-keto-3-deoxygluconate kinase [Pseudorhodobacter antarcticus]
MMRPKMQRMVAIGEAMVEMAPLAGGAYQMGFAGDTLNTAWYARRVLPEGWSVEYFTALGQDGVSDRMVGFLGAAGIGVGHIARLPGRTVGLYMIELRDGERSFAYWRGQSAARLLADAGRLARGLDGAGVVYLSGITLAILEGDGRDVLFAALRVARAAGAVVVFDPNLRPRLWDDTATMCDVVMQAAALSDIVLPSHEDEAAFFGDVDVAATAARYAKAGAGLVVVKNGGGEMMTLEDGVVGLHAPEVGVAVVDSTAAGDSFNAGFLSAWLVGGDAAASVRAGAQLAARVIGQRGALCEVFE